MMTTVTPTFGIERWDEQPTWEDDGRRITRATVVKRYQGDLEATGTMEYVMAYDPTGQATYVGLERVEGTLSGRSGSFVFRDVGAFEDGVARSAFEIVPGSGTGDLAGIGGHATVDAVHADTQAMTLSYDLDR